MEEKKRYTGLTSKEVGVRVEQGHVNYTNQSVSRTTKEILQTHLITYFNFLNLFLGVLVIISGQFKNLTFLGVIILNSIIGIFQEMKVKKLVDGLSVITASKAKVIRDGQIQTIGIEEIVMDDVIVVETGNQIGSDSIVLEARGIEVNESMLTGESRPVKKFPGDALLSGSFVVAGTGIAQVEHVGQANYAVTLANKAKKKKRATSEMQDSIKRIIKVVGIILIPVGILLFITQFSQDKNLSNALVSTVAGVIGMIPEGLVLLTSVSFILGVGRLAKKRALVQEMEAIESLARVNVLCLDKTGTITTGDLEVVEIVPLGSKSVDEITAIMNEVAFSFNDTNATQDALMRYFTKGDVWQVRDSIPFSSARKYRAISFSGHGDYVLGAPEFIIKDNEELFDKVDKYSKEGLRVLLLASSTGIDSSKDSIGTVVPLGFILITDCIREEARPTFEYFAKQQVDIKVISGDNPATVSNIAVKAGLEGGERYVDATTLPEDFDQLRSVVNNYTVFGRVTPEQKQNLVKAYQASGKMVGMVGDGVNDVLALKDSDCGIAMAAGSDAAKQVAHIVLLDSNFACMKDIVREGRMIISNIERVSALYLTKTIYSVLLSVIFIIIGQNYPFIPIHLSLISGTAIGLPSFFLALEQSETVTRGGFLKHVLRISLPGALTMVLSMLATMLMGKFFGFDDMTTNTYNLVIAGLVSMLVLFQVSSPLNRRRKWLCYAMVVLFVLAIIVLPGFFSVSTIFQWRMIFVIPLLVLVIIVMTYLAKGMQKLVK